MSSSGDGAVALAAWNVACGQLAMQAQAQATMVCGAAVEREGLYRCIYKRAASGRLRRARGIIQSTHLSTDQTRPQSSAAVYDRAATRPVYVLAHLRQGYGWRRIPDIWQLGS
jgi:hypothetical protein